MRDGKWKLVSARAGEWELYDIDADRTELDNLAANHPEIPELEVNPLLATPSGTLGLDARIVLTTSAPPAQH